MNSIQAIPAHAPQWFAAYVAASYAVTFAFMVFFGPFRWPFSDMIKCCFYLAPLAFPFFVAGLALFAIYLAGASVSDFVDSLCDDD